MSQENLNRIRRFYEGTYAHAEWPATRESFLAYLHPDLVYHCRTDEPDPSPRVGRDAYERLRISSALRPYCADAEARVALRSTSHTKLRDGLIVEGWEYGTKAEALKAAGLAALRVDGWPREVPVVLGGAVERQGYRRGHLRAAVVVRQLRRD